MDKRCTVCTHSQAHDINLALLAGTTLDTLKQQFGVSRSALHRHKQHLQKTLDKSEDRMRNNVLLSYLFQLNDYNGAAAATVAAARAEGNPRLTLQAANAGARIITAMAKFEVDLDHETMYRLMTSPEYVQSGCLLPGDPQILAGPRQTLVRGLAAACPEPNVRDLFDPEDVAQYHKRAQEPDANTYLPQSRQLEFPGFLTPLADVLPAAAVDSQSNASQQQPTEKRDRCGTEAGQTALLDQESLQNQSVKKDEENIATDAATAPAAKRQTANGKLKTATGSLIPRLRRKLAQTPAPDAQYSCTSDQLYEQYLREKAAALAAVAALSAAAEAQPPPPVPPPADLEPSPEPAPPTPDAAPAPRDRYAGYFKFPGDFPPGYLFAVAHGYWPDDPPEHIPDRRWEEDFGSKSPWAKIKGTY